MREFRAACGPAHLKAILATGDIRTLSNVATASMVCMMAGADFIKTSTGKEGVNATLDVSLVDGAHDPRIPRAHRASRIGFKPAGGVSTREVGAVEYQILMKEELGREWLEPELLRIGASSLLADIERQLEHHVSGRYSAVQPSSRRVSPHARPNQRPHERSANIFSSMAYGPAPEGDRAARVWLAQHADALRPFHQRRVSRAVGKRRSRAHFVSHAPARGERLRVEVAQGDDADVDAAVDAARAARSPDGRRWAARGARVICTRSRAWCSGTAGSSRCSNRSTTASRFARRARHRHAARRAAFSASRRLGATAGAASSPIWAPLGVIGQIVPWNFPLLMLAWKIAPALALGNCVVLKPAEYTPLTALLFAELTHRARAARGRAQRRDGRRPRRAPRSSGTARSTKIAFTGSTEVGRLIRSVDGGLGQVAHA